LSSKPHQKSLIKLGYGNVDDRAFAKWWKGSKEKLTWAIEDKDGAWWIVGGSEFPEKKLSDSEVKINLEKSKERSIRATPDRMIVILLGSVLGISLAVNILLFYAKDLV
jgi:hypothetical protein